MCMIILEDFGWPLGDVAFLKTIGDKLGQFALGELVGDAGGLSPEDLKGPSRHPLASKNHEVEDAQEEIYLGRSNGKVGWRHVSGRI